MNATHEAAEIIARTIRNGHPHDGSDLDYAVDEDARWIAIALSEAGLLVAGSERRGTDG